MHDSLISPQPGLTVWTVVTFLLVLFLLKRYAWKPILSMLEQRETTIREALEQARRAQQESATLLEQNRAILADAQNQANELMERARRDAESRRSEVVERARAEAEALLQRSREEIDRQKRSAIREIRAEVADLAIGAASRLVQRTLGEEDHRRIVDNYFSSLRTSSGQDTSSGLDS